MKCCLCLKNSENAIHIFGEMEDSEHIASIVAKHFWFEPLKDDPAFTAVCKTCREKLCDFHEFYEMVEIAHQRHAPETVTVKTEGLVLDSMPPSKHEPEDDFDELDEIPLSTVLVEANKSKTLLSGEIQQNFSHNTNDEDECYDNAFDMDEYQTIQDDSEQSDPFDDTEVTKGNEIKEETADSAKKIKSLTTRTRNSKKIEKPRNQEENLNKEPAKRGRKPKQKDLDNVQDEENKPKKQKTKEKANKNTGEESAYKSKMKSFDEEISQYMGLHCDVCNIAADNFAGLKHHMRIEHNIDNGYVKCCDKKFHKRANLLYHIRHHVNPNCYRCEECDQTFGDYQSLRNHLNVKHQKEEDKIFECADCTKKFARKYLLEQHRTFNHKERFKKCKMCSRRFKSAEELEEHNKEPCVAGIMCDICAKVIFGLHTFKRHQLEHQGGMAHKVQCDMCDTWHRDKYALRKHKRRHFEPKTPHVCDICEKVCPSREAMVSHRKYAHRSERTFECEFCHKCFKRPISLREHLTTHTGAVLYTCPYCPKTFNSNANMHSHRKNVHPVEFEEARKRRARIGYLGDQLPLPDAQKTEDDVSASKMNNEVSDIAKANEPVMMYNIN